MTSPKNTPSLLQLSGVIVDLIYRVETVPKPGEEAHVRDFFLTAGGGFNAMVAAKRAGMDVAYGGTLGTGAFADIATDAMRHEGIRIVGSRSKVCDQGCCTVLIDDEGERTFIAREGADGLLESTQISELFPDFDWCLLSGYALSYLGSQQALYGWLQEFGQGDHDDPSLVFDPSPLVAAIPEAYVKLAVSRAAWVSANAQEAQHLTGKADATSAAACLAEGKPNEGGAVVRVGEKGCLLAQPGHSAELIPAFAVKALDTNGAGDTHIGSFIAALAHGKSPNHAALSANASAALSTTKNGPATSPIPQEVEDLIRSSYPA